MDYMSLVIERILKDVKATGNLGQPITATLLAAGFRITTIARSASSLRLPSDDSII